MPMFQLPLPPPFQQILDSFKGLLGRPLAELQPNQKGQAITLARSTDGMPSEQTVLNVYSRFNQPELFGISLGLRVDGGDPTKLLKPNDGYLPRVKARVTWGAGAAPFVAYCDWMNGTTIAVCAERVRVDAIYEEDYLVKDRSDKSCAPCFNVSAGVGYGMLSRPTSSARRTVVVNVLAYNEVKTVAIPPFATGFTIVPVGSQTVHAEVYGFGDLASTKAVYDVTSPLTNVQQFNGDTAFPLFDGARFIDVTIPTAGSDPAAALVIFSLAL